MIYKSAMPDSSHLGDIEILPASTVLRGLYNLYPESGWHENNLPQVENGNDYIVLEHVGSVPYIPGNLKL